METELVNIFQTFAFPVALDVVLILVIWGIAKRFLVEFQQRTEEAGKANEKLVAYLMQHNIEVTAAITENATAMRENAQALNRFSMVLEKIEVKLNNIKE
jgi:hypothetical protein